jgi:predicted Zn-dependent protease
MSTSSTVQNLTTVDLRELSVDVVRKAMRGGATAAEVVLRDGSEFSTAVRLGEVETLKESGSRSVGVRVFFGTRSASTWSSDLSTSGIEQMVKAALNLAPSKLTSTFTTTTFTRFRRPIGSTMREGRRKQPLALTRGSRIPMAEVSMPRQV